MNDADSLAAYENVRYQVGFCGIWCGSCAIANGTLRELSRSYQRMLEDYGLAEWGPKDIDYTELFKGLASMQRLPLCLGCHRGGGREDCEIRACASSRPVEHCAQCGQPVDCRHARLIDHMRAGAQVAGMFVEKGAVDPQGLLEEWDARLRSRWPSCILFVYRESS
jgi:hypothetical protein